MESKDYTNIAGSPFQPYVAKQIELRKKIISEENRTHKELQWLTNKNVWIRVSSGTDVKDDNPNFPNEKGDKLSKKYILQAGLVDHTGGDTSYKLRSGIGPDGAYGIGGTDFGLKPMPGLENLTIKTGGKLGTLREATIEFTCYNIEQLSIMSTLYMRLGFSVLIEWGHIPYLDNKTGKLETNPHPLPFYGIHSKEELMVAIQEKRIEHSGNYDAMWGTIKNFDYSFGENGEFKCKVDLVGAGDILESLKINQSGNTKNINILKDNQYPVVADANKSLLNEALYFYYDNANKTTNNPYILKYHLTTYFKMLKINFDNFSQNNDLIKKGFHYSLLSKLNENNGGNLVNIPDIVNPEYYFSKFKLNLKIDSDEKTSPETQVYITLGHLLLLTLATGGIYDKKDSESNPYIYIDVNNETNRCYTFPGHCSLDPTVCLIGSEGLPFSIESEIFSKNIQPNFPFYDPDFPDLGGRFMWTLVNIDFIAKTLRKYSSSDLKGNVNFVDFVQDILTGISKACGGFNEFRIVPDDDTRCIRIFDDRVIPNFKYETEKYTTIPVLGKNSIVNNFKYTSKISPQMAAQIVIAAQAQDKGIQGSKDALSFSHLNEGLINRLSPSRIESVTELNEENTLSSKISKYIELKLHLEFIYAGESSIGLVDESTIEQIKETSNSKPLLGDEFIIPKNNLKDILQARLDLIYNEMVSLAKDKNQEGKELESLRTSYDEVYKLISNGTDFEEAYYSEEGDKIKTGDAKIAEYIHTKLEKNYKSVFLFGDSIIEDIWREKAIRDTKSNRSWY